MKPPPSLHYLKEMGISAWQVRNFAYFDQANAPELILPEKCKLLFVAADNVTPEQQPFFAKVVAALGLTCDDCLYLAPSQLSFLTQHQLQYCWACAVAPTELPPALLARVPLLSSVALAQLMQDNAAKQALWRQIKLTSKSI